MLPIRGVVKHLIGKLKHVLDALYLCGTSIEANRNAEVKLPVSERACAGNRRDACGITNATRTAPVNNARFRRDLWLFSEMVVSLPGSRC